MIVVFAFGLLLLPRPYGWLLSIPYAILLTWAIMACNRGLARIRAGTTDGTP